MRCTQLIQMETALNFSCKVPSHTVCTALLPELLVMLRLQHHVSPEHAAYHWQSNPKHHGQTHIRVVLFAAFFCSTTSTLSTLRTTLLLTPRTCYMTGTTESCRLTMMWAACQAMTLASPAYECRYFDTPHKQNNFGQRSGHCLMCFDRRYVTSVKLWARVLLWNRRAALCYDSALLKLRQSTTTGWVCGSCVDGCNTGAATLQRSRTACLPSSSVWPLLLWTP
jgi:hypothetical protein